MPYAMYEILIYYYYIFCKLYTYFSDDVIILEIGVCVKMFVSTFDI